MKPMRSDWRATGAHPSSKSSNPSASRSTLGARSRPHSRVAGVEERSACNDGRGFELPEVARKERVDRGVGAPRAEDQVGEEVCWVPKLASYLQIADFSGYAPIFGTPQGGVAGTAPRLLAHSISHSGGSLGSNPAPLTDQ